MYDKINETEIMNGEFSTMMNLYSGEFIDVSLEDLLIPSERVAHVQIKNNVEHALLVLTKSGYSAIPVLDHKYKLQGLISTPMIMDAILGIERIEFEKLDKIKVEEVMKKEIPRLQFTSSVKECLQLLIDHPFLCIENEEGFFEGIVTRRAILKRLYKKINE